MSGLRAEIITADKTEATGLCPYCSGTAILFDQIKQIKAPSAIIPFNLTKEDCKQAYLRVARKAVFTSSEYKRTVLVDSFRGIYMPYWSCSVVYKGEVRVPLSTDQAIPRLGKVSNLCADRGAVCAGCQLLLSLLKESLKNPARQNNAAESSREIHCL